MPVLKANGKRANGRRSGAWITAERRLAIYLRDGFACAYCGRDLSAADPREVSLDHLTPRSRRGGNASSNLVTACVPCNGARQDRPWRQYAPAGAVERIARLRRRVPNVALAKAVRAGAVPRAVALAEAAR